MNSELLVVLFGTVCEFVLFVALKYVSLSLVFGVAVSVKTEDVEFVRYGGN